MEMVIDLILFFKKLKKKEKTLCLADICLFSHGQDTPKLYGAGNQWAA